MNGPGINSQPVARMVGRLQNKASAAVFPRVNVRDWERIFMEVRIHVTEQTKPLWGEPADDFG